MQLISQYLELRRAISPSEAAEERETPITVEEISKLLYCSSRNVKLLMKKMADQGWIVWTPGRGRGNCSMIRFLASPSELMLQEAKAYAEQGNLKSAMKLLQSPGMTQSQVEQFMAWLGDYFGYKGQGQDNLNQDILRLPIRRPIITLDPAETYFALDLHLLKQVFDTLARYDPVTNSIIPHLAHDWECNETATRWTFYLRKDVRFHHGREMTSEDIVHSFLRLKERRIDSPNGWLAEDIVSVTPAGKLAVDIELARPNFMFHHYVSSYPMAIVPADMYSGGSDIERYPVGTGPFRLTRHNEGSLVLEAFRDYFRERAHLDRIEMLHIPKDMQQQQAKSWLYHIGKAKHFHAPAPSHWKSVNNIMLGCSFLAFNLRKKGPQQDPHFREAVHRALDRRRMIEELGMDGAIPAAGFMPPAEPAVDYEDHDIEGAKALLLKSGYNGELIKLFFLEGHRDLGEWIQKRCELIGIHVEIQDIPFQESARRELYLEADCKVGGVVADDDIARCLLEMYKIGSLVMRNFSTRDFIEQLDAEIARIIEDSDAASRFRQIHELERLLTVDHKVLFLVHASQKTVYNPQVKGVSVNTIGWFDFKDIWFKQAPAN